MMDQGNSFGFSSTQVQSYVNDGSGKPKIYSASKLTKHAPGGVVKFPKNIFNFNIAP